jgi:hypothetical protein
MSCLKNFHISNIARVCKFFEFSYIQDKQEEQTKLQIKYVSTIDRQSKNLFLQ